MGALIIHAFLLGALIKAVDWFADEKNEDRKIFGAYGLLLGYVISKASFGQLFAAATLAQIPAQKIDKESHRIALILATLTTALLGMPAIDWLFPVFFIAAWIDEYIKHRPLLPLITIATLNLEYIAGFGAFELGYRGAEIIIKQIAKKN